MHKWVPGTTKMRKEFQKNCEELLPEIDDFYIRVDVIFLTINAAGERYVKKYFGLGAFKLDMVFVLLVFSIFYGFYSFLDIMYTHTLKVDSILFLLCLCVVIYVVRDDGLNDLKRAFNVALMNLMKCKRNGELKDKVELFKNNRELFIDYERKFLHPEDFIKPVVEPILERIHKRLKRMSKE